MMSRGNPIAPTYRYEMDNPWRLIGARGVFATQPQSFLTEIGEIRIKNRADTTFYVRVGEHPRRTDPTSLQFPGWAIRDQSGEDLPR